MRDTSASTCETAPRSIETENPYHADSCLAPLHLGLAPDAALIDAVEQALRSSGYLALRQVEVELSAGVVILWGRVPSYHQKQFAQSIVQRVAGVQSVANGLDVVCCR